MQSIIIKMKAKNVLPALAGAMLVLQASAQHWGFSLQAGYLNNHITAKKLTSGPFEGFTAGATADVTFPCRLTCETGLHYRWMRGTLKKLNNDTRVSFVFYRNATKILVNYAYKKDIKPILIPAELKEISNGQSVKWVGDSLTDDEMLEVSLSNSSKKEGHTVYYGDADAGKSGFVFSNVPAGTYELTLSRLRKLNTQQNDGTAKGEITVAYYDKKTVTVK